MKKIVNKWDRTGNYAVDLVASGISHYRVAENPYRQPKSVCLHPRLYAQFVSWVKKRQTQEEAAIEHTFQFDGVDILEGSSLMIKDCYFNFYEIPATHGRA